LVLRAGPCSRFPAAATCHIPAARTPHTRHATCSQNAARRAAAVPFLPGCAYTFMPHTLLPRRAMQDYTHPPPPPPPAYTCPYPIRGAQWTDRGIRVGYLNMVPYAKHGWRRGTSLRTPYPQAAHRAALPAAFCQNCADAAKIPIPTGVMGLVRVGANLLRFAGALSDAARRPTPPSAACVADLPRLPDCGWNSPCTHLPPHTRLPHHLPLPTTLHPR